jgi:hypothetical protein
MSLRAILHLAGHVALPALAARLLFPGAFRRAWLLMLLANLVDLDHLVQDQVYDPNRCSIGMHPLHTAPAIAGYALLLLPARGRMLGVGLLLHMAWDQVDCWWMQSQQRALVSEVGHLSGDASCPLPWLSTSTEGG